MTAWMLDVVEVGTIPAVPLSSFVAGAGPDQSLDVPCFAFLLTSAEDAILVDTGPDPFLAHQAGFRAVGTPQQALGEALAHRHRDPRDVRLVVHTHLHYDHIQNDDAFERASVLVQQAELAWARGPRADEFCVGIADFVAGLGQRLQPIDSEYKAAPGVWLIPTRGHTPGHQAVLVSTAEGWTCVAGDEVPLAANLEEVPPACWDPVATRSFLDRASREHWRVLASHDPAMRVQTTNLQAPAATRPEEVPG